ncbi:MAG: aminoacyl-tRNA hydrolase, partial [Methylococcales bacterium]
GISPENILVAHDDLDFPAGTVRLKMDGGHGGHNGLRDIIPNLGAKNFRRLRIGIGHPGDRSQVLDYVLGRPSGEDRHAIEEAIRRSAELLPQIVSGCFAEAMNSLHAM